MKRGDKLIRLIGCQFGKRSTSLFGRCGEGIVGGRDINFLAGGPLENMFSFELDGAPLGTIGRDKRRRRETREEIDGFDRF